MLETIYAIPINEVFAQQSEDCPFCTLREQMEENEKKIILGAAMMDPDIRTKTNEKGFCRKHYDRLLKAQNRLGLALMLESHLDDIRKDLEGFSLGDLIVGKGNKAIGRLEDVEHECYLCEKVDYHMNRIYENTVVLWQQDREFRAHFDAVEHFCLCDYSHLLSAAKDILDKKQYDDFYSVLKEKQMKYFTKISNDVSAFCKSFDYRSEGESGEVDKQALEKAVDFLKGR